MTSSRFYADDYSASCLWLEDVVRPVEETTEPLPEAADVVIVGGGYTGLSAAREVALAGLRTLVIDAGAIGSGCSSRNGGQVAFSIKPSHETLKARYGRELADGIYEEALEANANLAELICEAGIACDWRVPGGFAGAHSARHFRALIESMEHQPKGFEVPFEVIGRERLGEAIDSPLYCGGVVTPTDASVHPAKLMEGLRQRAVDAGAVLRGDCRATLLRRDAAGWCVQTTRGEVRAARVLLATNGYSGNLSHWHQRRMLPIGSYIVATEPLDPALVERLIPHGRNVGDTRRVVVYVRPSPDGRRILFGGRAAASEQDVTRCVPRMHAMMTEMFPALSRARISRAWMGFVGFTFDTLPHLGGRDGLFHCMGYCGQGVPLATYYGRLIGRRIAGDDAARSALDSVPFPSRLYYSRTPWFLPMAVATYRALDRLAL
jgi:glycine/D-amino acid oxidase-like deaminating enzyme